MNERVVFLFDVDNTLLNNDRVIQDLQRHLTRTFGAAMMHEYWAIFEDFRDDLGYADYLGALQLFRTRHPATRTSSRCPHTWSTTRSRTASTPARSTPWMPSARGAAPPSSRTAMSSSSPARSQRSGLADAVDGRVLIYVHKEEMLEDVATRFPADHYVMMDDKLRLLTAMKDAWGARLTTVFVQQGHYAADPAILSHFPPATLTIERIDQLQDFDFGDAWTPGHLPPPRVLRD